MWVSSRPCPVVDAVFSCLWDVGIGNHEGESERESLKCVYVCVKQTVATSSVRVIVSLYWLVRTRSHHHPEFEPLGSGLQINS